MTWVMNSTPLNTSKPITMHLILLPCPNSPFHLSTLDRGNIIFGVRSSFVRALSLDRGLCLGSLIPGRPCFFACHVPIRTRNEGSAPNGLTQSAQVRRKSFPRRDKGKTRFQEFSDGLTFVWACDAETPDEKNCCCFDFAII